MEILLLGLRLAAAAALYAFLGAVLLALRRDLVSTQQPAGSVRTSARLVVLDAEEPVLEAGTTFALHPVTSIGRGADNTITIADSFASTRHALVSWRGNQWWVEDLGSRNGTQLNGVAVHQPTVVASGDTVAVGRTIFRMELYDGPGADG
jgi:predicted component of type VI protein secretion system